MALFSKENLEKANKAHAECLDYLNSCLTACDNFLIMGDPDSELKALAVSMGYQVIPVELCNINPDLIGTRVIVNVSGTPCASFHVAWADPIFDHPNQKFLVVFYIEDADPRAIDALKPIIEDQEIQGKHLDNFFVGLVCREHNKKIQSTILPLIKLQIDWC